MRIITIHLFFLCTLIHNLNAQDTFSILAFDSITREVGAAGASCVDLFTAPGLSNDFICEIFPDTGAIASQAAYIPQNQKNARYRMRLGDGPTQLINWLQGNDVGSTSTNNFTYRQYGVIRIDSIYPQTAAFTGTSCMNYKSHRVGPNYTIHGNILLGAQVLDSMEAKFLRAKGDLACKLMAAMQGANMVGADSRCAPNGSSSLFAFLKVTLPTDTFGKPNFIISLKTHMGDNIEPIDSLQKLFDAAHTCTVNTTGIKQIDPFNNFWVYPNPATQVINIQTPDAGLTPVKVKDITGRIIYESKFSKDVQINVKDWPKGVYFIEVGSGTDTRTKKVSVQ